MRTHLYLRLAVDGIRKNKRHYIPYILAGSGVTMMYYILSYLTESPAVAHIYGGDTMIQILPLGARLIAFFSLIFLFYTNSFLVRQRNQEFGLYNVLGMDKRNISRIMLRESLIVGILSLSGGLLCGLVLSKLAETFLLNLTQEEVSYELYVAWDLLGYTALIFGIIYLLLLCYSLVKVWRSKPLELLRSSKAGEKPPKANAFWAIVGLGILIYSYYEALAIETPLSALTMFFIIVLLVVAATYFLFCTGSVVFCRILQKNKKFYYRTNHFVAVSSMVYRMKRNGAGLATICILSTMVLVMVSSTASLYIGSEDAIRTRYPYDINIELTLPPDFTEEQTVGYRNACLKRIGENGELEDYCLVGGVFRGNEVALDHVSTDQMMFEDVSDVGQVQFVSLEDYNRLMGTDETLQPGECLTYSTRVKLSSDTFSVQDGKSYRIKKKLDSFFDNGMQQAELVPVITLVIGDFDAFARYASHLEVPGSDGMPAMTVYWMCGINLEAGREEQIQTCDAVRKAIYKADKREKGSFYLNVEGREENREYIFKTLAGLFFLGIMLSIVFLAATVLILYYKQISEGYEDESRFDIMMKVGMTKKNIQQNINSQIRMVFFLPLLFAGMHLAFALPVVWKLLQLFGLPNLTLVIVTTVICFLVFSVFYALVYKLTAGAYYNIVSGKRE